MSLTFTITCTCKNLWLSDICPNKVPGFISQIAGLGLGLQLGVLDYPVEFRVRYSVGSRVGSHWLVLEMDFNHLPRKQAS